MNRTVLTRVLAATAAIVLTAGCASQSGGGSNPGGGGGGGNGGGGGLPTDAPVGKTTPKPTNKQTEDNDTGYVEATRRPDPVSCGSVNAEVTIIARGGASRWTARAQRGAGFAPQDRTPAGGISVQPASGSLTEGRTATIRVSGEFDRSNQYFYVLLTSRNGGSGHAVEFKCR